MRVGFASGGHPLPLLLRSDGRVEPVGAPGTLLGVVPDPSFEDRSVELCPGDALVFYTDGVIEDRGDGALEENRLAALLSECAGAGADAIADARGGRGRALPGRSAARRHRGARPASGRPPARLT